MEINEKKLKKILKEQREEYQRHIDVVAENFSDEIKLLAESLTSTKEELKEDINSVREELKEDINSVREELKEDINSVREMVAKNTEDITIIRSDIEIIKQNLRRKVDLEEFEALEKRVAILESKIK